MSERPKGGITFTGGNKKFVVRVDGEEPGGMLGVKEIFREDYKAGADHGAPTNYTSEQLERLADYNAGLSPGRKGVRGLFNNGEMHPVPKRDR